jgi:hypothetical protein
MLFWGGGERVGKAKHEKGNKIKKQTNKKNKRTRKI